MFSQKMILVLIDKFILYDICCLDIFLIDDGDRKSQDGDKVDKNVKQADTEVTLTKCFMSQEFLHILYIRKARRI